ncbi:adenylate/guanylate cyclase domain-containing protein [Streptomyces sp. NRRL S-350]|uniref:adenylate/guanylate cyclase domain-containing protein n=1 Tax=Streptomyces sp. NRRL S-350 TaxID=1463902 RepID=UPI0004C1B326|nr:adenylate/guanylate cyclase domain-containing protein [Streptomyces sp. NRRL S-350]
MPCPLCAQLVATNDQFCPACGTPRAAALDLAAEERKLVTVVFCDLVDSTALSGALDPETLREVILRYFERMHRRIEAHGGTLEKFIGDAVMAVFGVPVIREDDAHRALAAALAMLEDLEDLNTELDATLGVRLDVRIGVNTGQVVAGSDASARQALISGETVNIAARLQTQAAPGQVLIGAQTLRAAGPAAQVDEVGPLRLKGKAEPVTAYRLVGLDEDDPELLRRFDVPLVGRERELAGLDAALARVAGGSGAELLLVAGEAGIGKTRLVRDWRERVGRRTARCGTARCRSFGEQGVLAPLAEAVRTLLDEPEGAAPAEALARLAEATAPGIGTGRSLELLAAILRGRTVERPAVLVLDDCQWAGAALLDAAERLIGALGAAPVLLLCLGRPELRAARPELATLPVGGLSWDESALLAAQLTELSAHQDTVPARLLERAEGNPLHLEELLAALTEADGPAPADELPPAGRALLSARIDGLERDERATLDLAAVLGRAFTAAALAGLAHGGADQDAFADPEDDVFTGPIDGLPAGPDAADDTPPRLHAALARLAERHLVEPAGAGYRFSSGLVQESVYQSMSKRARAERHERAADLPAVRATGDAAVGGHLERAHRYRLELGLLDARTDTLRSRAATALGAAGAGALARAELAPAVDLLERAVRLHYPNERAAGPTLRRLGEARLALGRADEALPVLAQVRDSAADPLDAAHARLALAARGLPPGQDQPAATARAVLPLFADTGDDLGQARARLRLAEEHLLAGRHTEAERLLDQALDQVSRTDAELDRAAVLAALAASLLAGPEPVPNATFRLRALLAEHGPGRRAVRVALNGPLAVLLALRDRPDEAELLLAEANGLAGELSLAEAMVALPALTAQAAAATGQTGQALDLLADAAGIARHQGSAAPLPRLALTTARVLLDTDRPAPAARHLDGVDAGVVLPPVLAVELDALRGRLAAARGESAPALDLTAAAQSAAEATESLLLQALTALDRAHALLLLGRPAEAAVAAATARDRFAAKGHLPGVRRAARLGGTR